MRLQMGVCSKIGGTGRQSTCALLKSAARAQLVENVMHVSQIVGGF